MNVPFKKNIIDSRKSKYASTIVLLENFISYKLVLSSASVFHKMSLIVACCMFGMLEIRTLTPNRFKIQTNDILKLLDHNSDHQQGFFLKKIVALHHAG